MTDGPSLTGLQNAMIVRDDRQAAATEILLNSTVVDADGVAYMQEGALSVPVALYVPAGQKLPPPPEGIYISDYAMQTYGRLFPELQTVNAAENTVAFVSSEFSRNTFVTVDRMPSTSSASLGTDESIAAYEANQIVARGVPVSREISQALAIAALGEPVQSQDGQQVFAVTSETAAYRLRKVLSACGLSAAGETLEISNPNETMPEAVRSCIVVLGPQTMANVAAVSNETFSGNPVREDVVGIAGGALDTIKAFAPMLEVGVGKSVSRAGIVVPGLMNTPAVSDTLREQLGAVPAADVQGGLILPGMAEWTMNKPGEDASGPLGPVFANETTMQSGLVVVTGVARPNDSRGGKGK